MDGNELIVKDDKEIKNSKKTIRNLVVFILLIILTFYIILKDQNVNEIFETFKEVKIGYIFVAVLFMCIYVLCETLNIGRGMRILKEKSTFFRNLKYALIGFFFSAITPAASGGQPMQIYYMHKDGISVGNATLTLLINLSCTQVATISIALISVVYNYKYLNTAMVILFIIGILLNASALAILLISIFSKRLSKKLVNFVIKIMKKLKIKNVEEKKKKLEREMKKYQAGSRYIKKNKYIMLKTVITTFLQFFAFYSISYWVYRSYGYNEYNFIEILTLQSIVYATVSGLPSPGAVGVSEGAFIAVYNSIFPETILSGAMLINRCVNFYLLVIVSGIVVIINEVRRKKLKKKR